MRSMKPCAGPDFRFLGGECKDGKDGSFVSPRDHTRRGDETGDADEGDFSAWPFSLVSPAASARAASAKAD